SFLFAHFASSGFYSIKKIGASLISLWGLRNRIKMFKNYDKSHSWRSKLTHPRKFWQLELFNIMMATTLFLILILQLLLGVNPIKTQELSGDNWLYWVENLQISLGVCLGLLALMIIVNGVFLLFPMKYPIKSVSMEKLTKGQRKKLRQMFQNDQSPHDIPDSTP
ncbi:MAG: hypothetical protein KAR20_29375, partial [Candidatus Heimdallarchaeota archaeon]|nr:hypothetical protein [Candidatus Heimdallarchaeota archaeon]